MKLKDRQLYGFLAYLWITAFLALLGLETRYFLYEDAIPIAFILPLIFILCPLIIKRIILLQLSLYPKVTVNGKEIQVKYGDANPAVQEYVNVRAQELGVSGFIRVLVLPLTYNMVDAYVFGSGENQTLVLTGGSQVLYLRGRHDEIEQFKFLIDHELGHIHYNDTGVLYLARAILLSTVALLPVKLFIQFYIYFFSGDPFFLVRFASQLLPNLYDKTSYLYEYGFLYEENVPFGWMFFILVLYQLGSLILFLFFYIRVVRHREYTADRFAYANSPRKEAAKNMLTRLVGFASPLNQPTHAFSGKARWHPELSQRLEQFQAVLNPTLPGNIMVIGLIGLCILYRFCFGQAVDNPLSQYDYHSVLNFLSALFVLFIGFIIDTILSGYDDQLDNEKWKPILQLTFWGTVIATLFSILVYISSDKGSDFAGDGMHHLFNIGLLELILLYYSIPVTILVFGLIFLLIQKVWEEYYKNIQTYIIGIMVGCIFSVLVLTGISYLVLPLLKKNGRSNLLRFKTQYVQSKTFNAEVLDAEGNTQTVVIKKVENHIDFVNVSFIGHSFYPPLSFVALKQGPFKADDLSLYNALLDELR